jgi:hypothetical protein
MGFGNVNRAGSGAKGPLSGLLPFGVGFNSTVLTTVVWCVTAAGFAGGGVCFTCCCCCRPLAAEPTYVAGPPFEPDAGVLGVKEGPG